MENYLELEKARSFGEKINATFEFIRLNFKPLVWSMTVISLPAILIATVSVIMIWEEFMDFFSMVGAGNPEEIPWDLFNYGLILTVASLLAFIFVQVTILEYLNIYREKRSNQITVSEVWDKVKESIVKTFVISFLLALVFIGVYGIMVLLAVGLQDVPFLAVLVIIVSIFVIFYAAVAISIFYNILINENRDISDFGSILNRCFFLIKGKWWSTFGIIFISSLIVGGLTYLVNIPMFILGMGSFMFDPESIDPNDPSAIFSAMAILYGVNIFLRFFLQIIPTLAVSFQYFNLVELKEAKGLMSEISQMDSNEDHNGGTLKTGDHEADEDY